VDGRFAVWDLPPGVYRVRVDLKPPLRLWKYSPGFQLHADPDRVELLHCPARVELIASRRAARSPSSSQVGEATGARASRRFLVRPPPSRQPAGGESRRTGPRSWRRGRAPMAWLTAWRCRATL